MDEPAITVQLQELPEWSRRENTITRTYKRRNFRAALDFVNQIGDLAEAQQHHPDITIHGWNRVTLTLSTHSAGGLTDKDFELAKQIDGLPQEH